MRIDAHAPYSAANVKWQAPKLDVPTDTKEGLAAYARAYRAANPAIFKAQHLRKKFGITLEQHAEILKRQLDVCAICKGSETVIHPKTGLPREMAVDHCHASGQIRALLCSKCNTGLGSFRDDPALLRAAADYLEHHAQLA